MCFLVMDARHIFLDKAEVQDFYFMFVAINRANSDILEGRSGGRAVWYLFEKRKWERGRRR